MSVKYLKNSQIDFVKWDKCIAASANAMIYGYAWYLNIVAKDWDALVEDDYVSVMPLTYRVKYGVKYLYQPYFTQQLGVFSKELISNEKVEYFLTSIPLDFKYIDIVLNTQNFLDSKDFEIKEMVTYELDMITSTKKLLSGYSENTKRNLSKSGEDEISINDNVLPEEAMGFIQKNITEKMQDLKPNDLKLLQNLINNLYENRCARIIGAYTPDIQLCALAVFVYSIHKVIFLVSVSNEIGKKNRAMFMIVNKFITTNSGQAITIDFEGSQIEGVARFYAGFGATPVKFLAVKQNRLPKWTRWLKK